MYDNAYTKIGMVGTISLSNKAGTPSLPVRFVKLLLPPKTTVSSIDVSGSPIEMEIEEIDLKEKPVIPYQNPVPIGDEISNRLIIDSEVYTSSKNFPPDNFDNLKYTKQTTNYR